MEGAPSPCKDGDKLYDASRRKLAHFIGMDFLFTQREYFQSIQTDSKGVDVLVNSTKNGDILVSKPVPKWFQEKPWFKGKFRFPRSYLGISKIDERVSKLSWLVHLLTKHGFPSRAVAKSVYRLSLIWPYVRYETMRKHVKSITRKVISSCGPTRSPWKCQKAFSKFPVRTGDKIHENGIITPLWSRTLPRKEVG